MIDRTPTIVLALVAAASAAAQDAPSPPPARAAESVILAPTAVPPAPLPRSQPPRAGVSAEISSVLPPFDPRESLPKPSPAPSDADKPHNQMPRLPANVMERYVVHGARPPVFRTRDLYTRAGLIDLAFKEHPLMRIGNFFGLKEQIAYKVIIDEQLAEARSDLTDEVLTMADAGDPAEAKVLQQAIIDEAFEAYSDDGGGGPVGIK